MILAIEEGPNILETVGLRHYSVTGDLVLEELAAVDGAIGPLA